MSGRGNSWLPDVFPRRCEKCDICARRSQPRLQTSMARGGAACLRAVRPERLIRRRALVGWRPGGRRRGRQLPGGTDVAAAPGCRLCFVSVFFGRGSHCTPGLRLCVIVRRFPLRPGACLCVTALPRCVWGRALLLRFLFRGWREVDELIFSVGDFSTRLGRA